VDLGPGRPDRTRDLKVERYHSALLAAVLGKEIKWPPSRPGFPSSAPKTIHPYSTPNQIDTNKKNFVSIPSITSIHYP
jgi:hypothetical protein